MVPDLYWEKSLSALWILLGKLCDILSFNHRPLLLNPIAIQWFLLIYWTLVSPALKALCIPCSVVPDNHSLMTLTPAKVQCFLYQSVNKATIKSSIIYYAKLRRIIKALTMAGDYSLSPKGCARSDIHIDCHIQCQRHKW